MFRGVDINFFAVSGLVERSARLVKKREEAGNAGRTIRCDWWCLRGGKGGGAKRAG